MKLKGLVCLLDAGHYKPGDLPPASGLYNQRSEWARVQVGAGLKQVRCGRCSRYQFPQELSDVVDVSRPTLASGAVVERRSPVCRLCAGGSASG
jgi:hypothetical protein